VFTKKRLCCQNCADTGLPGKHYAGNMGNQKDWLEAFPEELAAAVVQHVIWFDRCLCIVGYMKPHRIINKAYLGANRWRFLPANPARVKWYHPSCRCLHFWAPKA